MILVFFLVGNVQCGLFEKVRFIKQQVDNDNGDKGGGCILDDMLYYWDIGYLYVIGGQCQCCVKCCVLVDF